MQFEGLTTTRSVDGTAAWFSGRAEVEDAEPTLTNTEFRREYVLNELSWMISNPEVKARVQSLLDQA